MLHMKYAMDNIDNIVLVLNKEKYEREEIKKRNSYLFLNRWHFNLWNKN